MDNVKQIVQREIDADAAALEDLHPLLARIYGARRVKTKAALERALQNLLPYQTLLGVARAVERLYEALQQDQRIIVVGDFDADGATSCALACSVLKAFGSTQTTYLVPNRFTQGYGLTIGLVQQAAEQKPALLLTVDNGIACVEGVAEAHRLGIEVIITDHHLAGPVLPQACAIVNPNQPGDPFPSKCLAGVGVVFYLLLALRAHLREKNWFALKQRPLPNMSHYLDLVALGTVADLVPLDQNNRILVFQGLARIRAGQARPGIAALLQVAARAPSQISAEDLGFFVGPRLNAAGRLTDMSRGIACLLADDLPTALCIAQELDTLNKERRQIEKDMQQQAWQAIKTTQFKEKIPVGICLYEADWHQGVIGLIASRIKDQLHRPVIAFAPADAVLLKGSARSIPGVHIRDVLASIATANPGLITAFGGHAMAAGLSVPLEHLPAFSKAFAEAVQACVNEEILRHKIFTDGVLEVEALNLTTAQLLNEAGPWGQGFAEPSFEGVFELVDQRLVGQRHLKMILAVPDTDLFFDAIAFQVDLKKWPNYRCHQIRAVYRLGINEYQGRQKLQLLMDYFFVE